MPQPRSWHASCNHPPVHPSRQASGDADWNWNRGQSRARWGSRGPAVGGPSALFFSSPNRGMPDLPKARSAGVSWLRGEPRLQGQQHWLRAGAAATRGFRPPRGSASCSNTRARYIHVPLGRNPLAATSFAMWCSQLRRSMPEPASTKPRTSRWRKTRWCGDRAQAGHGWPALACWSQGRRNQAMRPIRALPRLPPKPVDSSAFQPGRIQHDPNGRRTRFSRAPP